MSVQSIGKIMFHAIQYAVWHRGPASDMITQDTEPTNASLNLPDAINTIFPANITEGSAEPKFN